jgi:glutathione S-transferase
VALNLKSINYEHVVVDSDVARTSNLPGPVAAAVPALPPVLLDQRRMFIKTLTIIEYLDESYPQPPLLPEPRETACRFERWQN